MEKAQKIQNKLTTPKVSVVIPVYKTPESYLRSCIESVLHQSIQEMEIILVDDGSPDSCGTICDEYAKRDPRITVIHQDNSGVSAARNAGLLHATGQYLTFIDSDDMLTPNAWELAISALEAYHCDCVVFGWNDYTAEGKYPHSVAEAPIILSAREAMFQIASDNFKCGGGYPWNKMWKMESFHKQSKSFPLFNTELYTYEDKLWIIEALKELNQVILIPDILYEYRFLPTSLIQDAEAWKHRQFNAYDAYDKILDTLQEYDKKAYEGALKFYFYFCFNDLRIIYPSRKQEPERFSRTHKRLVSLSKRIQIGELHKPKYIAAWIVVLLTGWFPL